MATQQSYAYDQDAQRTGYSKGGYDTMAAQDKYDTYQTTSDQNAHGTNPITKGLNALHLGGHHNNTTTPATTGTTTDTHHASGGGIMGKVKGLFGGRKSRKNKTEKHALGHTGHKYYPDGGPVERTGSSSSSSSSDGEVATYGTTVETVPAVATAGTVTSYGTTGVSDAMHTREGATYVGTTGLATDATGVVGTTEVAGYTAGPYVGMGETREYRGEVIREDRENVVVQERLVNQSIPVVEKVVEKRIPVIEERIVEKEVRVPVPVRQEVPVVEEVVVEKEVPVIVERVVERPVPVEVERIVERPVVVEKEVPIITERVVEKEVIKEVPIVQEHVVEREVAVPLEKHVVEAVEVERRVPIVEQRLQVTELPQAVEKLATREVPVVQDRIVEKFGDVGEHRTVEVCARADNLAVGSEYVQGFGGSMNANQAVGETNTYAPAGELASGYNTSNQTSTYGANHSHMPGSYGGVNQGMRF